MPATLPHIHIVSAKSEQVSLILDFIRKLADYEKLSDEVVAEESQLREYLFGPRPAAEVVLAFVGERAAGFALFFTSFSTFLGRPGIYLEDLFVDPDMRGAGVGKALLKHLARLTVERGYGRLEWSVLNWNEPSIAFYRSVGAKPLDAWTSYRLSGEELKALAGGGGNGSEPYNQDDVLVPGGA
jgi:GNAT superfamily N-acetyltransferase